MTELQKFLFKLPFSDIKRVRNYMLRRYNVYCGNMANLERAINDHIPNEDILPELTEVLARHGKII